MAATLLVTASLTLLGHSADSQAQDPAPPAPPALELVGNFETPQYVAHAPGAASSRLLFVVEDEGTIRVVNRRTVEPEPFLDIRGRTEDGGEQGLLSVAFPPDYETSGKLYVYFTSHAGNNVVEEFQVSPTDPTDALESTQRRVIAFSHPVNTNHNGGQLQFGPDGMLWIATGDGGGPGDPGENAQDLTSPLGKLLRIDPDQDGAAPYSIPADNPFVGVPGRDEIWAYGLRNPWRFSFDGNRILVGDVGQASWEEVDYETIATARGANFGWDNYEGTHPFEGPVLDEQELPILEYSSQAASGNCAVTGGYVVRDSRLPDLVGRYVYADFCAGQLRSFVPAFSGAVDDAPLGVSVPQPASFGLGAGRRLYVASLTGPVYRIAASLGPKQ